MSLNKFKYFLIKKKLEKHINQTNTPINFRAKIAIPHTIEDKLDILKNKSNTFSTTLLKMIDEKNMTDVNCYKKANIDRKLFSKIRSNKEYKPSKNTVFAFVFALQLNITETNTLLESAGYSLSHSFITDIIIEYFIEKKKYDINLVNLALSDYNQPPLGSF